MIENGHIRLVPYLRCYILVLCVKTSQRVLNIVSNYRVFFFLILSFRLSISNNRVREWCDDYHCRSVSWRVRMTNNRNKFEVALIGILGGRELDFIMKNRIQPFFLLHIYIITATPFSLSLFLSPITGGSRAGRKWIEEWS